MKRLLAAKDPESEPFDTEIVAESDDGLVVRAVQRRDGLARTYTLAPACSARTIIAIWSRCTPIS